MRLGISIQRGLQLLPLVIPPFTRKYPHVKIELIEHGSDTLERLTTEGECDIALITTNEKPSALEYILLETEQLVLMADRSTDIAQRIPDGTPIDITEAASECFVCLCPGHSVRTIQDRLFQLHQMKPSILLESNSLEACKNVAARAGAVMICPYVYIAGSRDPALPRALLPHQEQRLRTPLLPLLPQGALLHALHGGLSFHRPPAARQVRLNTAALPAFAGSAAFLI